MRNLNRLPRLSIKSIAVFTALVAFAAFTRGDSIRALITNWTTTQPMVRAIDHPGWWSSFEEMHIRYRDNFVNSEGMGMERIATFDRPSERLLAVENQDYRVAQVRLLGLYNESKIYTASWVAPMRSMLPQLTASPLSESQRQAVQRMELGANVVWVERPEENKLQAYGALRALPSCLQCHEVDKGTLLGAFVYELVPSQAVQQQFFEPEQDFRLSSKL